MSSESYRLDTLVLGSYVGEMSPTGYMEDCWDNGALGSLDSAHKEHAIFWGVCSSNCQNILPLPRFAPQPQASKHSCLTYCILQRGPESGDEKIQPQDAQTTQSRSRDWAGLWHPFGALAQSSTSEAAQISDSTAQPELTSRCMPKVHADPARSVV